MTIVNSEWAKEVVSWEYSSAAKPDLKEIPVQPFPASLHENGETRVIELDLSQLIGTDYVATTPSLLANYVRICEGDKIETSARSTSEVFYVMRGAGQTETANGVIEWKQGDAFTLPTNDGAIHTATEDTALYWVHDAPLLKYMGVVPMMPRFKAAYYSQEYMQGEVDRIREECQREGRNRNGIILGNVASEKTKTMTHTMWSLYNLLPAGDVQKPHRHNSVAIDLAVYAGPETYTMIAKDVDENGELINPVKAMWAPNSVFVTPPGWWHSHHNHSDEDAYVFPVQDAGLQTYLRTLDIQFIR